MEISKTIAEYLKNKRRITVPGLGTFLVKEKGGEFVFSEFLKEDDGVLRGLLVESEMSEIAAAAAIDRFVFELKYTLLNEKKECMLEGLGILFSLDSKSINFKYISSNEQDKFLEEDEMNPLSNGETQLKTETEPDFMQKIETEDKIETEKIFKAEDKKEIEIEAEDKTTLQAKEEIGNEIESEIAAKTETETEIEVKVENKIEIETKAEILPKERETSEEVDKNKIDEADQVLAQELESIPSQTSEKIKLEEEKFDEEEAKDEEVQTPSASEKREKAKRSLERLYSCEEEEEKSEIKNIYNKGDWGEKRNEENSKTEASKFALEEEDKTHKSKTADFIAEAFREQVLKEQISAAQNYKPGGEIWQTQQNRSAKGGIDLWLVIPIFIVIFALFALGFGLFTQWQTGELQLPEGINNLLIKILSFFT